MDRDLCVASLICPAIKVIQYESLSLTPARFTTSAIFLVFGWLCAAQLRSASLAATTD